MGLIFAKESLNKAGGILKEAIDTYKETNRMLEERHKEHMDNIAKCNERLKEYMQ